jgi:homoserine/homoserine lactone efflux protein
MTLSTWLAFFTASWLISLSPGAGAISCMSAGLRYGYRKALWNILGLQAGIVVLVAIVALGLGAALATSVLAFNLIKWFGVAYLCWLGVQQWRAPVQALTVTEAQVHAPRDLLLQGLLVNVSNPKGIIFMLAVLPQFIDPALPSLLQYLQALATLCLTDLVVMSGYTLLAARVLSALRNPVHIRWLNRGFGALFVAAGLLLAGFRRAV